MSQGNGTPDQPQQSVGGSVNPDDATKIGRARNIPANSPSNRDDGTVALPPRLIPHARPNESGRSSNSRWTIVTLVVLAAAVIAIPSLFYAQVGISQNPA